MAVTASRQPAHRPETIRTRLARFMPKAVAAGWSVAWSASNEHAAEIASEDELAAAEHLGCYGAALAHALAKAEIAPTRLRLSAETQDAMDNTPQPITLEIRAKIPGSAVTPTIIEGIARRTEASCPVWKGLAAEGRLRIVAIAEDPEVSSSVLSPAMVAPVYAKARRGRPSMPRIHWRLSFARPAWLTPKMGLVGVALGVLALRAHMLIG